MATFELTTDRVTFYITIRLAEGAVARTIMVCDDGWKIWLKDRDTRAILYWISFGTESERKPNRDDALGAIQNRCGWWSNNRELFTDPPKFHETHSERPE
jgi:hypothetical protein